MTCPICNKESEKAYRPFCSKRCADVDLGRWFNGTYAVPSDEPISDDERTQDPERDPQTRH